MATFLSYSARVYFDKQLTRHAAPAVNIRIRWEYCRSVTRKRKLTKAEWSLWWSCRCIEWYSAAATDTQAASSSTLTTFAPRNRTELSVFNDVIRRASS